MLMNNFMRIWTPPQGRLDRVRGATPISWRGHDQAVPVGVRLPDLIVNLQLQVYIERFGDSEHILVAASR
jgi:hypothetical protein